MYQVYQEYGRNISRYCTKMPNLHFHQSQHNRYRVWTPLDDVALLSAVLQQDLLEKDVEEARKRKRKRRPRRYQTRPWLAEEIRRLCGGAQSRRRPQSFFNYLRMEPAMFDELLQRVGPRIEKQDTNMRKALPRQPWSWPSQWGLPFRFSLEWHQNVSNAVGML